MSEIRVLTCDADGLRGGADALGAVIRAARPDIALVRRAPERLRWRSKRAALARQSALVVATAHRPGGLLVMTTLAVSVHATSFHSLASGSGVSAADVTLAGGAWRVAAADVALGDVVPAEIEAVLGAPGWDGPLVVGDGRRLVAGPGVEVTPSGAVTVLRA